MIVEHVSLVDFRNYSRAEVALAPGANLFVGRNGQGKTNLAEAIAFFATLGSHRVSGDQPLVREGQDAAIVRVRAAHGERHITLETQVNKQGSNRARVNGQNVRPTELPRYVHVVLFAPEDLAIVRSDPSARRRFVDQLLVQLSPRLASVLADYDRVVRQRTTLLKSARARGMRDVELPTLDVWNDKLVELGSIIIDARAQLVETLREPLARAYAGIAGADHKPELSFKLSIAGADADDDDDDQDAGASASPRPSYSGGSPSGTTAERFRAALAHRRRAELERGLTLVGPHRDDLVIRIRDLPVKGYASHGESWSVALALRLASAEVLRTESRIGDPVLILDDVFAELDAGRRGRLAALTEGYEQVIVTAAVEEDVPRELAARVVRIEAGAIVEAERGSGVGAGWPSVAVRKSTGETDAAGVSADE
ncbi:DNA replication/repair protein RecF [uncultured Microbacterium sp.]|uniref:DNA replication/repair protein RecF n=1 Tax=uncultured Microbacterium sp. TaxID=191216 RepID=UPI0025F15737|nr:DNA replication/repair protein RecF [uncultured Microbacterium sp.]